MAGVAPQGPIPVSQTPGDPSAASQGLSWEGDKMFNIYIYDYCYKRGFRKTAQELLREAEIPVDSTPPINARQGLLFEWWSVFWVLFTAKANGNGTDDAMLYTQHQAHQSSMKQNQNRPQQQPLPMPSQPMGRGVNGMGPQRGFAPNGIMPNGIPQGNGQPPGPTAFVGGPMQPNGIMSGPPAPPGMGQQMGGQQPFMQPRPPMGGPQRVPNGGPPFQSPTMAHSPPNPGQQSQPPPQHPPPPMGQLGPPHRGGMLPPGQQGMNPGQQTPTPSYQNIAGRPPSRTSTPQGMMNPSPSMLPRQPMVPPGSDPRQDLNALNTEIGAIPVQIVNMLKTELNMGDKNIHSLTFQDKTRILNLHRQRSQKPGPPSNNAAAGPSAPPRRNNKRNSTSPGEDQQQPDDGRNGSSPPDRKRVRRSPMEPQLPSAPMNYAQHPNQPPQSQPGGPGGPQQQAMGNGGMMRPMGGPMNGGFQQQGQPNLQQQMSGPMMLGMNPMMPNSMPNTMSPQMHNQPTMYRQGMHNIQQHPNRMSGMNAGSPGSDPSFNPGVPMPPGPGGPGQQQPGGQQQFAPGSRLAGPPNTKQPMSMLPPPSPAKDQNGPNKDNKGPTNGHPEGSPRNQPLSGPNPGTAPPTPGPGQGQGQPGQNQNMAQSPGLLINPNSSSMNPVAMSLSSAPASASETLFSNDFIQSVANGLDEFDVGLFRGDGDINFERDFGQWFNPDDVGSMELGKQ
ncbi:hypothetical protein B0H17DRAFT_999808 [Mycena rosella]|uniref:LisH domain-containing protein n=1 Tax=Mycena rosella TaxID=1033263 RepID=A0AAD7GZG0_MYCRO|nr:hypothetical protein B0H17DRAFT_999808 [Mycena rosella]